MSIDMRKLTLFLFVLLLASCGKPGIVGKWASENVDGKMKDTSTEQFTEDGRYKGYIGVKSGHIIMEVDASGKYELKGDSVIISIDSVMMDGKDIGKSVVRRRIVQVSDTMIEFSSDDKLIRYKRIGNE